jgi:CBS domain containing-hemolysin-like protein
MLFLATPGLFIFGSAVLAAEEPPENLAAALLIPLLIIVVLVLFNGLFVAAEFAMIGVRPSRMQQLADEGSGVAAQVLDIRQNQRKQDRYIATAQVGITLVTIVLGMYGEPAIAHFLEPYLAQVIGEISDELLHTISLIVVLSMLTYLHVVVGEMVPKSLALMSAERTVMAIMRPMAVIQTLFAVPVRVLNGIGALVLRLMQIPSAEGHSRAHTPEELEQIVVESTEGGLLLEEEEEMIRNIFDFGDRQASHVMTPRPKVEAIPLDMSHDALLELVSESRHSRFPVYEDDRDHVIGILHLKDLVQQELETPGEAKLRELLRPAPAVPEDHPLTGLLAAFKRLRIHMAIVLDEFGGMAGIVTLEDIVEEIVGEVRDEFDTEDEPYEELEPGIIEAEGTYLITDLMEELNLRLPTDTPDVETVGGLVVTALGRPPHVGDEVVFDENVHIHVLDVEGRAVTRVRVRLENPAPPAEEANPEPDTDH